MATKTSNVRRYQIERLLERMTNDLHAKHKECVGVSYGEVKIADANNSSDGNWTAEVTGVSKEGRAIFEEVLKKMRRANHMME